jgi:hypothetical protein
VGEVVFAAWFMLPLVPYANVVANVVPHSWCILFGAVLFCFGCEQALRWTVDPDGAGDERQAYHYHIGVMWLLESEFVVICLHLILIDASLLIRIIICFDFDSRRL